MNKTIALIGGGHTNALFLRAWARTPIPDVTLRVFDPQPLVTYTGMLPGYVAGHYAFDELQIDLEALTKCAGGEFYSERVTACDTNAKTIKTANATYTYDVASFDIGIHSARRGTTKQVVGVKPLTEFALQWQNFIAEQEASTTQKTIVVIGGGVAGVEVALAMAHRLRQETGVHHRIIIIEQDRLLKSVAKSTQHALKRVLDTYHVTVRERTTVTNTTFNVVQLNNGEEIISDLTVLATGPQPYEWVRQTDLALTDGYISVTPTLQSSSHPDVFAVGDCAHFVERPLPKAGVYAVREAPVLYRNIRASILHLPFVSYSPQSDYLKLISLGEKNALVEKWGLSFQSRLLWQLKNHIDNTFMDTVSVNL